MKDQDIQIIDLDSYEPSDAEILSFVELLRAPDQLEWEYDPQWATAPIVAKEEVDNFHKRRIDQRGRNHPIWAICNGRVVGMIGINRLKGNGRDHCGEIGFGVVKDFARQGIGNRLLRAAIGKARTVGLTRLEADCFAENAACIALLRKSGFQEEGLRPGAVVKDGALRDQRLFGLLLRGNLVFQPASKALTSE